MREIKFRAWSRQGYWMSENYVKEYGLRGSPDITLMQYTGLKDKNGKEILEGDIISDRGYIGEAKSDISPQGYCFSMDFPYREEWVGNSEYEIIGNIYENPDLLTPHNV